MNKEPNLMKFQTPKDWFLGLKDHWKSDIVSGFLVFLIALPLCLGISTASGFPAIAGIYTAIIGGIVVSFFSGSYLTIKGPAAGLIAIALGAVEDLGKGDMLVGYKLALATIVVAGVFQILFGLFKAGSLASFFPAAAVHGLLASIGIIIMAKQIHVLLGVKPTAKEPLELISEIPNSISHLNPIVTMIGLLSLVILFILPQLKNKFVKLVPGPLMVLFISIPFGLVLALNVEHDYFLVNSYHINPKALLVNLPDSFLEGITFPDFSQVFSGTSIKYIIMFALIGSIESLLSSKAVDILDPYKRKSNMNKDLVAIGIGNTLVGFIGGLPMISEIVRSSANINNGGKTRWSNFFHGFFLLTFVVALAAVIKLIPNTALAAMLIFTGFRLASPKEFIKTFKVGPDQFVIFVSTIVVTLATDLLIGIAFGIGVKFLQHLFFGAGLKSMFTIKLVVAKKGETDYDIKISEEALFTNLLIFERELNKLPLTSNIVIDFSETAMIDHTFMDFLHGKEDDYHRAGGSLNYKNLDRLTTYSVHPLSSRKLLNDGIFAPSKTSLNERQHSLVKYAEENSFEFDYRKTSSILKFSFAPFVIARRAKYGENILIGHHVFGNFFFADIHVEEGAMITKQEYKMTILFISDIQGVKIPDFTLEKEGVLDAIKEFGGYKDIDFVNYPSFSDFYYLTGANESDIRAFFKPTLIELLSSENLYCIESNNNSLLIHGEIDLININQMKKMLAFADKLIQIIKT